VTTVFVTATGTEVGKTWTVVRLAEELRARGRRVAARKPAQSFAPEERGRTDAELLAAATGDPATTVCVPHRWYETPMAPCLAAAALGRPPFTTAQLVAELGADEPDVLRFVEGAGGPRSPLASDGDNVDLARALAVRLVVLVADAGLGTINAVRLAVAALDGFETVVFLNRLSAGDPVHTTNRQWLLDAGYPVVDDLPQLAARILERLPSL
jgi:dethiobiotin synthetase